MTHTTFVATEPANYQNPASITDLLTKEHQISPFMAVIILAFFVTAVLMATKTKW